MLRLHCRPHFATVLQGGVISWLICGVGCSTWKETAPEAFELPATRMSRDSVALEITFVRVPVGQPQINEQLWQQVDEQRLTVEQRLHLNNNGFRCGFVGLQLPEVLRELLDKQQQESQLDQSATAELDVLAQNRRVQSRAGQRSEIVTGAPREEMVVLHKEPAGHKVVGKSFRDAQCILAARSYPQGDGSVRLEFTPEVHHGQPQNQWVAGEGTFQLLAGRQREVFQDLLLTAVVHAGETIVLSCTPDVKGLGQNFFVEAGRGDAQQKLLLIRLAQTQRDELFEATAGP